MRSRLILTSASLLLAFELSGCGTGAPRARAEVVPSLRPNSVPPPSAGLPAADIERGSQLVIAKCARCHKLYDPAHYSDPEWNLWMTKMSKKAHLAPDQQQLLIRYLGAFRSPSRH